MTRSANVRKALLAVGVSVAVITLLPPIAFLGGRSLPLDRAVSDGLHGLSTPAFTKFMTFLSTYAYHNAHWWLIGAVGLFFLAWKRSLWEVVYLAAVRYGSDQAQELIKNFYARPRPVFDWVKPSKSFSYPSGTVTVGAALCLALAYLIALHVQNQTAKRVIIGSGWVVAVLIAVSRIYLGAHWLTDTLAALSLAGAIVALALLPLQLLRGRQVAPVRVPGMDPQTPYAEAAPTKQQ